MEIKEKRFVDPIFRAEVIVTFGKIDELGEWYKKRKITGHESNRNWGAFFEVIEDSVDVYHLHFQSYGFTTIVHETNHLAFTVLTDRGIRCCEETKEVFAYYQDYIAGKCRDILENWTKNEKK